MNDTQQASEGSGAAAVCCARDKREVKFSTVVLASSSERVSDTKGDTSKKRILKIVLSRVKANKWTSITLKYKNMQSDLGKSLRTG